jgi:hypothetical protein
VFEILLKPVYFLLPTGEVKTNNLDIYQATVKHSFLKEDESWEIAQTLIADEVVYVDEFVFRLNDGNVKRSTLDRIDLIMSGFSGLVKPISQRTILYQNHLIRLDSLFIPHTLHRPIKVLRECWCWYC